MGLFNIFKNKKDINTSNPQKSTKETFDQRFIDKKDTFLAEYDLIACKVNKNYYVPINLQNKISQDLMSLNDFIGKSREILRTNIELISDLNIRYNINSIEHYENLTKIELMPLTKTGKIPKFPVVLHFNASKSIEWPNNNTLFGHVFYFPDGKIGKAEVISWVDHNCYILSIAIKNNRLSLKRIHTNDKETAKKINLYKADD